MFSKLCHIPPLDDKEIGIKRLRVWINYIKLCWQISSEDVGSCLLEVILLYCSICGSKTDNIYIAKVEGVKLEVCEACAKFGRDVKKVVPKAKKITKRPAPAVPEVTYEIIQDYASKIRSVRISSGMNPKDFASRINEKESVMKKIESGKLKPSLKLAEKIERQFGAKLIEQREVQKTGQKGHYSDEPATFGDIVKVRE
jgi:putative transcription factor